MGMVDGMGMGMGWGGRIMDLALDLPDLDSATTATGRRDGHGK